MTVEVRASRAIDGVRLVVPVVHADERGTFVESYRRDWFPDGREMVQGNRADRRAGAVVGLHFHRRQTDFWQVARGHARVILYDLRAGSPTEGATEALDVGEVGDAPHNHLGVSIPAGVAHGFASLTDLTLTYLVDRYYDPADELGVAWNDPSIAADWGIAHPVLSDRDRANPRLDQLDASRRPQYTAAP